jgi:hypothetical protein
VAAVTGRLMAYRPAVRPLGHQEANYICPRVAGSLEGAREWDAAAPARELLAASLERVRLDAQVAIV